VQRVAGTRGEGPGVPSRPALVAISALGIGFALVGAESNDKNGKSQPRSKMTDDSKKEMVEIQPVTCTRNFSDCGQIRSA
jgi:hypothetical protein